MESRIIGTKFNKTFKAEKQMNRLNRPQKGENKLFTIWEPWARKLMLQNPRYFQEPEASGSSKDGGEGAGGAGKGGFFKRSCKKQLDLWIPLFTHAEKQRLPASNPGKRNGAQPLWSLNQCGYGHVGRAHSGSGLCDK